MKLIAFTAAFAAIALAGCADNSPGGKAVRFRHQNMKALGKASKEMGEELKKASPDLAVIRGDANQIHKLAPMAESWFPVGSGPQDNVKTDALAAVWTDKAGFHQVSEKFVQAADELQGAAERNDLSAIRTAAQSLGESCKGCHDKYKKKD